MPIACVYVCFLALCICLSKCTVQKVITNGLHHYNCTHRYNDRTHIHSHHMHVILNQQQQQQNIHYQRPHASCCHSCTRTPSFGAQTFCFYFAVGVVVVPTNIPKMHYMARSLYCFAISFNLICSFLLVFALLRFLCSFISTQNMRNPIESNRKTKLN